MNTSEDDDAASRHPPLWQWPALLLRMLIMGLIHVYRLVISPMLGPRCRFHPTCSAYALEALRVHGLVNGLLLTVRRVSRCHPGNPGGYDPVPPAPGTTDDA